MEYFCQFYLIALLPAKFSLQIALNLPVHATSGKGHDVEVIHSRVDGLYRNDNVRLLLRLLRPLTLLRAWNDGICMSP